MKKIPLTHNKVALVDDADYDYLSQFRWMAVRIRNKWFAIRYYNKYIKYIYMHREITGTLETRIRIRFTDGNSLNCQRDNLQTAEAMRNFLTNSLTAMDNMLTANFFWLNKPDSEIMIIPEPDFMKDFQLIAA